MKIKKKLESLIDELLDGKILLNEALEEFEKVFIEKALARNKNHISNTASDLGIHRNTIAKRIASYNGSSGNSQVRKNTAKRRSVK